MAYLNDPEKQGILPKHYKSNANKTRELAVRDLYGDSLIHMEGDNTIPEDHETQSCRVAKKIL